MATVNQPWLYVGRSSPSRIEEFRRNPALQNTLSHCRACIRRRSERSGCSLMAGAFGHGFLSGAKRFRTLQAEEKEQHYADQKQNACQPWAGSRGHCQPISCIRSSRRAAISLLLLTLPIPAKLAIAADEEMKLQLNLEAYTDEKQGFTILRPSQWNKIDKAGATVLFEDPQSKGNNVGVVVNPVKISSLKEFGTVDVVADKLLQAEKRKPSTNDVQLIEVKERQVHGGAPLFQLEYKLDSSRGVKRILSAVTVASRKLYILNVAYTDSVEKPLLPDMASVLEKIATSFDVLN